MRQILYQKRCWQTFEKDKETIKTIEVRIADTNELMKNTEAYMNKLKEFI